MSRGRQKRVEKAQERREDAKKKKVRKEIRSFYKSLVQNQLLPLLDKVNTNMNNVKCNVPVPVEKIHLWVDAIPNSRVSKNDIVQDEIDEDKSSNSSSSKKNRKKKSSMQGPSSAKKAHPRSVVEEEDQVDDEPLLCRRYFFTNECTGNKKTGKSKKSVQSCQYGHNHHSSKHMTLAKALMNTTNSGLNDDTDNIKETLKRASKAAAVSQMKLDGASGGEIDVDKIDGIDMLHHLAIPIKSLDPGGNAMTATELISKTLVAEKVPISGIAYVVYNDNLLYDRFEGGKMIDEETEKNLFESNDQGIGSIQKSANQEGNDIVDFSGPVLELILTFLPDKYSGLVPTVCKSFSHEIGTHSPALWKYLLSRHNWPMGCLEYARDANPITLSRDSFVNHFYVYRRVEALNHAVCDVMYANTDNSTCTNTPKSSLIATKMFGNQKNGGGYFSELLFWDENSVLAVSKDDCVLRMFNVSSEQNSSISCKLIIELRVAPVPASKKQSCSLESVALDDRYLSCVYIVDGEFVITSILKEHILTNSMEESIVGGEILKSHDLTTKFLEFREENMDTEDYAFLVHPLLANEDNREDLFVSLLSSIYTCGHGVFCAIAEVFLSGNELTEMNVFTGIITLSASKGRNLVLDFIPLPDADAIFSLSTNYQRKDRIAPTVVAIKSPSSSDLLLVSVDRNGKFRSRDLETTSDEITEIRIRDHTNWCNILTLNSRNYVVTSYLYSELSIVDSACKSVAISVQNVGADNLNDITSIIKLRNVYQKILAMAFIEEDYLMITCACINPRDPEWRTSVFANNEDSTEANKVLDFVMIHMPSRSEIHCSSVRMSPSASVEDMGSPFPVLMNCSKKGAMAAIVGGKGICVTGINRMGLANGMANKKSSKTKKVKTKKKKFSVTGKKQGTGLLKL